MIYKSFSLYIYKSYKNLGISRMKDESTHHVSRTIFYIKLYFVAQELFRISFLQNLLEWLFLMFDFYRRL